MDRWIDIHTQRTKLREKSGRDRKRAIEVQSGAQTGEIVNE
jgi:hypothetical protein